MKLSQLFQSYRNLEAISEIIVVRPGLDKPGPKFAPQDISYTVTITNTPPLLPMEQVNMGQGQFEIW